MGVSPLGLHPDAETHDNAAAPELTIVLQPPINDDKRAFKDGVKSMPTKDYLVRNREYRHRDGRVAAPAETIEQQRRGQQQQFTSVECTRGRAMRFIELRNAQETVERRAVLPIEIRKEDGAIRIQGHAAVFNQEADIAGYFREVFRPGAFASAIRSDDIPFLIEHAGLPLARNTSGTLKLHEDSRGLAVESSLDGNDPDVMRIVPKMERGDLSKMSIAFSPTRQEWDETSEVPLRIIYECRLYDVSIVTSPAYDGTDIGLRSLADWREQHKPPLINRAPLIGARLRMRHALRIRELT